MTDESAIERAVDRAVMRRLETDRAYRNAENAEDQAEREQAITDEEYARIAASNYYGVCGCENCS